MIDLEQSVLPSEITSLLMLGGTHLAEVVWHTRPKQTANDTLGEIEDAKLFGQATFADEQMGPAIRALLLLWNGWPAEAAILAEMVPEPDRSYLLGLRERQLGRIEPAKTAFRNVGQHPIYLKLTAHAIKDTEDLSHSLVKRFNQLLMFNEEWEPFLFIDILDQAQANKLDAEARTAACKIQVREFELLLRHCLERLYGENLEKRAERIVAAEREANALRLQKLREKQRASSTARRHRPTQTDTKPTESEPEKPEAQTVKIACPKCGNVTTFPEAARGKNGKCGKCGAVFAIPKKDLTPVRSATPGGSGLVTTACPKCGALAKRPEADRGKKCACKACGQVYLIPKKQPVA
ncbi:MAG: hypothetical protein JXQ73_19580 [Phycisphaerae bacterium]|nr:hypothetical protein [Phycisphaerae bacterium]